MAQMMVIAFPMDSLALLALLPALLLPALRKGMAGHLLTAGLVAVLLGTLATEFTAVFGTAFPAAANCLAALLLAFGLLLQGLRTGARDPASERHATLTLLGLATLTTIAVLALKTPTPAMIAVAVALLLPQAAIGTLTPRLIRLPATVFLMAGAFADLAGIVQSLPLAAAFAAVLLTLSVEDVLRLRRAAERDDLTGLYNRRAFMDRAGSVEGLASVILMDIDHFKAINDRYGHAGGDLALVHVARILSAYRRSDRAGGALVGRLGGEEFGLLLPGIGEETGIREADRLRQTLATSPLRLVDAEGRQDLVHLTASFGVSTTERGTDAHANLTAALRQADMALYDAKKAGRNRAAACSKRQADLAKAKRALHAAAVEMRAHETPGFSRQPVPDRDTSQASAG
ncbi:diguanylate cyclase (GGDEF) domain-containing protein [Rhizobium sp. RU20A]|uniref:GGDEF domain-containing protein n=1 Tax=Rhizobium sp. RU20A TaxID=1907412 RepID=UPI000956336B|nr:GGDEF domain-containing protein [Rhizobium sp. RU20A]SIQ20114.1 diguanylate cyclase (GGDEF) domain-containing protein [Rhizobium sp. RU20A]